ncbi:MAG: sulfur transferase domain-containing protein, partial [Acidobacteria bacterium]|nr:sulfur transferase domain-containing protein [Acidobacteriota bacterium]
MNRTIVTIFLTATLIGLSPSALFLRANPQEPNLKAIEESLKDDVPRVLCLNKNFATAGQPKAEAFARLAKQGFRSVLNLRTADEGAEAERELVEKAGMRYLNIPVVSA